LAKTFKISIITATYNSEKFIYSTVASVNKQTYPFVEHIFVDGASSDKTIAIIKKNSCRENTIVSEPDKGIYDALNKGIEIASGNIIGFLHSDDEFFNDKVLDRIAEIFVQNPNLDIIFGDLIYVSSKNSNKVVRRWIGNNYSKSKLEHGWMPAHPTFFMKTDHYKKFGGFDINYDISADYDAMIRYLYVHQLNSLYLPFIFTKMRLGGESNKSIERIFTKTREDIQILKSHKLNYLKGIIWKNISKIYQFFL
jgi:glycosyltransferase